MVQFRNERSGELVNVEMTRQQILDCFNNTTDNQNWLWFWLAKHAARNAASLPKEPSKARDMIAFLGDSFLLALGMGLKKPMIRLHYKDRRFKIYLSKRGTLCFKSGALVAGTNDPIGDEEYMGCLANGQFIAGSMYDNGPRRQLLPVEQEVLDNLSADPAGFMSKCSKDMDRCCYCGKALDDKRSKDVGYGATCAAHWGLPWGKTYDEKVPSFATMWANSNADTKRDVRGVCLALRKDPRDEMLWNVLGDILESVGYTKRPTCPTAMVQVPRSV